VTDFAPIAHSYDQHKVRLDIARDSQIAQLLVGRERVSILDVGCGTGNYIRAQLDFFGEAALSFVGVDASGAMLTQAAGKAPASYVLADALALPFHARFEYVVCNFAFHHFPDKARAAAELVACVAAGGALHMVNICPERMEDWWVYRCFPQTREADRARFWTAERIDEQLEQLGLRVELHFADKPGEPRIDELLAQARRRDISELAILDAGDYASGLKRLEEEARRDPAQRVRDQVVLVEILATRP